MAPLEASRRCVAGLLEPEHGTARHHTLPWSTSRACCSFCWYLRPRSSSLRCTRREQQAEHFCLCISLDCGGFTCSAEAHARSYSQPHCPCTLAAPCRHIAAHQRRPRLLALALLLLHQPPQHHTAGVDARLEGGLLGCLRAGTRTDTQPERSAHIAGPLERCYEASSTPSALNLACMEQLRAAATVHEPRMRACRARWSCFMRRRMESLNSCS